MSMLEIFLIALSLSLDCFAISISSGGTMKFFSFKNLLKMSLFFGIFQSIMPIIGFFAGIGIIKYIRKIDHWIAFLLLFGVGLKMIYESYKLDELNCQNNPKCPFGYETLILLSIATSIDALAVGFTFSILNAPIITPVIVIGITAFTMSIIGINLGYKGKKFFGKKMELVAGLILILIGLKILTEHMIQ